jgi:thiol:disulfide interchange protein DsbC
VIGRIYDMEARQDLTAARLLALNPDLLAAGAARRSNANEDGGPACPSAPRPAEGIARWPAREWRDHLGTCQRSQGRRLLRLPLRLLQEAEAELKAIGARVEERPISIFGADSRRDAERVLCSPRPEVALHMAYSGLALANPKPCDTSGLDANEAFAKAHGFGGTPVIVRPSDGASSKGYRPAAVLRDFLPAKAAATAPAPKG